MPRRRSPGKENRRNEFPGGCGLALNGAFWDVDNTTLAGEGLVAGIGCTLAVNTGCGLTVNSGFVEFDPDTVRADARARFGSAEVPAAMSLRAGGKSIGKRGPMRPSATVQVRPPRS